MSNINISDFKYGRMMFNKFDKYVGRSIELYGEYCEFELDVFKRFTDKDSVFVDVGANLGAFTIPMAQHCKEVFAFEPYPYNFHLLCGNIALNDLKNVKAEQYACGDKLGVIQCTPLATEVPNNLGAHAVKEALTNSPFNVRMVPMTLPCTFMKVDVEGFELQVLQGAKPMIDVYKPVLFVENDRNDKSDELLHFITKELEYDAFWFSSTLFNEDNYKNNKENVFGNEGCTNVLCLHKDFGFDGNGLKRATFYAH